MAKITKKQVENINNKCFNGFKLDLEYFLMHNEKQLVKYDFIDDTRRIEYCLHYFPKYEKVTQDNGISYNVDTGRHLVTLRISKWSKRNTCDLWSSNGLGKRITLSDVSVERRKISLLEEYTSKLNDEKLNNLYENAYNENDCFKGIIVNQED